MTKRINRSYMAEFKQEAVALVTECPSGKTRLAPIP